MHTQLPANRLVELRKARSVSIMDIAVACGVHTSTVSRWQDGVIPQTHLPTLARLLGVSVPYLAGWSDENAPAEDSS